MRKQDFDERLKLVNEIRKSIGELKTDLNSKIKGLDENISEYIKIITEKDESFYKYIENLSEFDFSDSITTPSDLFPGVRVTSNDIDISEVKKKTEEMKDYAGKVDSLSSRYGILSKDMLSNIKKCLAVATELDLRVKNLEEVEMDLLNEMNSVYDVGMLARSSK